MDDKNKNQPKNQLNIEISDEVAEGFYSNLAIISHSNAEFVIDFLRILPNVPKARVKTRIILTPDHAKRFLRALQENIAKFESNTNAHSNEDSSDPPGFPPMNFNTPPAIA